MNINFPTSLVWISAIVCFTIYKIKELNND